MNEQLLEEVGKRIHRRRRFLGLTQEQLADRMDVSIQMVSNLERGNKAIRIDNLINLSRILGVSTDYILTGRENRADPHALADRIARLPRQQARMLEKLVDVCLEEADGD